MAVRVAINGFGRIGRNVMRAIIESGRKDIEVVSINDLGPVETNAHLFRFDSVHGRFNGEVKVDGDTIDVGRGKMKVTAERDPSKLPHKEMGVDIALECTGFFTSKKAASAHLDAGAHLFTAAFHSLFNLMLPTWIGSLPWVLVIGLILLPIFDTYVLSFFVSL